MMSSPASFRPTMPAAQAAIRFGERIALLVILSGMLVLAGWHWNITVLKTIRPDFGSMKPMTAVSLILAGLSLWLARRAGTSPPAHLARQFLSILVAALGGLVLLEYAGAVHVDLDLWLFPEAVLEDNPLRPGRFTPRTAYCLLLIGTALLALDAEALWLVPLLALQVLLISFLTLVGYAYHVTAFYQFAPHLSVGLHTAALLFLMGIGILCARPERYLAWLLDPHAGSRLARRLLPTAILFPFLTGFLLLQGRHAGLYDTNFGWALFASIHIIVFSGMIFRSAKLLNRADAEREAVFKGLEESEERFRLLFDASPNGVLMTDLEGKIKLANRESASMFGYPAQRMHGQMLDSLLKEPADEKPFAAPDPFAVRLLSRPKGASHKMIGLRSDGSRFNAQVDGRALSTRQGNMLLVTLVDISQRMEAEKERNRFIALADASLEFIGMCDQYFQPFYVNPAGMRLVGLDSLDAALKVRVPEFFFPEDRHFISHDFFPAVMRDGHGEVEIRFRHFRTGEAIWMLYNVFNLRNERGEITGWATVSRNIQEYKLSEKALKRALAKAEAGDQMLKALMEHAPIGIAIADAPDATIRMISRAGQALTSKSNDALEGCYNTLAASWDVYRHDGTTPADDDELPLARATRQGESVRDEVWVIAHANGRQIPLLCNAGPIRNAAGHITGGIVTWSDISERQHAENALRESETRFRNLIESYALAVWETDAEGFVQADSPSWRAFTGQAYEEWIATGWSDAVHPEDRDEALLSWVNAVSACKNFNAEYRIRCNDGSWRWTNARATPVLSDDGLILKWVGMNIDIDDRKKAEEALRRSERRLRRFYDSGLMGVIYWNVAGQIEDANDKFLEMLGYSRDDLRQGRLDWNRMTPPEFRYLDEQGLRQLKTAGAQIQPFEKEYFRKDGSRLPIVLASAMLDEFHGVAFVLDNTEKKRAERQILRINADLERRVEERTQELEITNMRLKNELTERERAEADVERFFKMSADLIGIIGPEGVFRRTNAAFETTLGYSADELKSLPFLDFVHPEERALTEEKIGGLARGEAISRYENRFRCKDGSYRWLGWTLQPAPGGAIFALARDITEHKINEARIAASLREKEALLKEIHHRVKNNLQVIASMLRLQAETLDDPAARTAFQDSQQRIRSMALAHEHLYQSRSLASISMSEYIASLVNSVRRSYSNSAVPVRLKTEVDAIELDIEKAVPIGLIISELVANSFKHGFNPRMAKLSNELWVKFQKTDDNALALEVGDNGCGISKDLDIANPQSMGLHLVHSFALQLNGQLTLQRQPDTVFSILIPNRKPNHA